MGGPTIWLAGEQFPGMWENSGGKEFPLKRGQRAKNQESPKQTGTAGQPTHQGTWKVLLKVYKKLAQQFQWPGVSIWAEAPMSVASCLPHTVVWLGLHFS